MFLEVILELNLPSLKSELGEDVVPGLWPITKGTLVAESTGGVAGAIGGATVTGATVGGLLVLVVWITEWSVVASNPPKL